MAGKFIPFVTPDDDVDKHFNADAFNAFAAAANANKENQLPQNGIPLEFPLDPNTFAFRNDSGGNRARYDILGLSGVTFTPTTDLSGFQADPIFTAVVPTLAYFGKWGIVIDPVKTDATNKYGRLAISGTWVVKLRIDHVQHEYADVTNSNTQLVSNWYGSARILYKESGTGTGKWAIVRLGDPFLGPIKVVNTGATISAGGSGQCTIYFAGAAASPTSTAVCHVNWMDDLDFGSGHEGLASYFPDEQKLIIVDSIGW